MALLILALLLLALVPALSAQPHARNPQPPSPVLLPEAARATLADGDENWDDRFGHPSLSYTAHAMAVAPDGNLYVGGSFSAVGGIQASGIAHWDGQRWHPLGAGVGGTVYALAIGPDGALYAGGYFANAGGVRVNSIARWDPATEVWSSLGQGLTSGQFTATVYAIAFQGATLYAGGDFTTSGQTALKKLARWTGAAWEDLGAGLGRQNYDGTFLPEGPYDVRVLAARGTDVFVGGRFDAVAEGRANALARFDTQTGMFHVVGGGVGNGFSYEAAGSVTALAADAGRVCVGGKFDRVGVLDGPNAPANNVACWDGAAWDVLASGIQAQFSAQVDGLALVGTDVVVTGQFDTAGGQQARRIARWDGTAWAEVGGGLTAQGYAVTADGQGGFFVTGGFDTVGDNFGALRIARWTGTAWQALGQGLAYSTVSPHLYAVAVSGGRVYVGGGQTHAGGVPAANISAWDGTQWHALGSGTDGTVRAVVAGPDGSIYAGGDFTVAGGQSANRVAKWNPATESWSPLGTGTSGDVLALAIGPNGDLYVGGEFTSAGGVTARYVARWDGTAWHALGAGVNWYVFALAIGTDGKVYAGGDFDEAGGGEANGIAVWNGANWSALGPGVKGEISGITVTGEVNGIAVLGSDVYATGEFSIAGTGAAAGIARWNQAAGWSALGAGLGGGGQTGYALATDGQHLYVGGDFASAGGQPSPMVARWDVGTQTWSAMGSGVVGSFGSVYALALDGGDLYVAGRFETAGSKPAGSFSVWHGQAPAAQAQIQIDPETLNFGDAAVGTQIDRVVTITNVNTATGLLTGTVSLPAGSPFTLVEGGGPFTLQPGASLGVMVRFSAETAVPATATLTIQHNAPNAASPAQVALSGNGTARGGNLVVLRNFDPNGPQTAPGAQTGGFVFGTNGYKDKAKATVFTAPMGKAAGASGVSAVRVWFAYADPMPGEATYTLHLYAGTSQTGPTGEPLFSQTYRVADTNADDDLNTPAVPTEHAITPPLPVAPGGSFFAVVDFGAYTSNNLLAITSGAEVQQRVPEVWEQFDTGAWVNVSDSWKEGKAGWQMWVEADLATATPNEDVETPLALHLGGAAPNPFRAQTAIRYTLDHAGPVTLAVYDVTGRRVATLVDGVQAAGAHAVTLDARDLASGTYLCRLQAGGRVLTQPVVIVR